MDFDEAGASGDLQEAYQRSQVSARQTAGRERLAAAKHTVETLPTRRGRRRAEPDARAALAALAGALNWAEGTVDEDQAHAELDAAGAWVRRTFGCRFDERGGVYRQTCPVALSHTRIGFSVGGSAQRFCSLCGSDLAECPHRKGKAYLVPGGAEGLGWCRVCLAKEGCEHKPDELYRARVIGIIREMTVDETSLVAMPAHPDARPTAVTISVEEMRQQLGEDYVSGMTVSCDRCLSPCGGLQRPHHLWQETD